MKRYPNFGHVWPFWLAIGIIVIAFLGFFGMLGDSSEVQNATQ